MKKGWKNTDKNLKCRNFNWITFTKISGIKKPRKS